MLVKQADPSSAPVSAVTESALIAKAVMPAKDSAMIPCTDAVVIIRPLADPAVRESALGSSWAVAHLLYGSAPPGWCEHRSLFWGPTPLKCSHSPRPPSQPGDHLE